MTLPNMLIDILPLLLLAILFWGAEFVKPLHSLNRMDYLSPQTGKHYRGFFAIVVVFHHLAQRTETGFAFRYFSVVGYLAVAFFFFLSGYGLQKSYIAKSDQYRKGFLLKRIPSVLIPYIIISAIYLLLFFFEGKSYSLKEIRISLINGNPIADYSWFIINIIFFYFVYWVLMLACRNHYFQMILFASVWYVLYAVFCNKMGYGVWWYNASQVLIVGMFWATYEEKILDLLDRFYIIIAPIVWASFVILFAFRSRISAYIHIPHISQIIALPTAVMFVLCVVLFSLKVQIKNKVLRFLGEISLEIYISQGLFIRILRGGGLYINNEFLWCLCVLVGTIIFSIVIHGVFQCILRKYDLLLRRSKI